ncbi:hypothetical protein evm_013491 [Chilo suppressalis]|nr:hypothetical protein evm_013491 [Chilo suppressalis]
MAGCMGHARERVLSAEMSLLFIHCKHSVVSPLVFSQSLYSLDLIEHFLGKVDEATQEGRIDEKLAGHVGSWSPGVDYFRLDGSTSCENRSIWCKNFNREDNPRARWSPVVNKDDAAECCAIAAIFSLNFAGPYPIPYTMEQQLCTFF